MSSQKFSDSNLTPLPPAKPDTLLVSDPLTRAEIDLLRQGKKSIAEYVQKMYPDRESFLRACKQKASSICTSLRSGSSKAPALTRVLNLTR